MFALFASNDDNGDSTMVTSDNGDCCFLQEQTTTKNPNFFEWEF